VIMSEFNSVSCGGVPNISDTFGVGSLWTIDYALQLASVGYTAAHLHTRERGVTYNIVAPPEDLNSPWTTGATYYSLLATAEILHSANGSIVVDLNIGQSMSNPSATVGGYAIYDASGSQLLQVVLFNFATSGTAQFALSSDTFPSKTDNLTVKYLTAPTADEKTNISWGGQTLAGAGNGQLIASDTSPNQEISCSKGCMVNVSAPGMALIFANGTVENAPSSTAQKTAQQTAQPTPKQISTASGALGNGVYPTWGLYTAIIAAIIFI